MSSSFDWNLIYQDFYIDNLPVNKIIKKYALPVNNSIYRAFPNHVHDELKCEYCQKNLESKFINRGQRVYIGELELDLAKREISEELGERDHVYGNRLIENGYSGLQTSEGYLIDMPTCQECDHKPKKDCRCENCRDIKISNYQKAIKKSRDGLDFTNEGDPSGDKFTFQNLFSCLLVLSDECATESSSYNLSCLGGEDKKRLIDENFFFIDENSINEIVSMSSVYEYRVNYRGLSYKFHDGLSVKDSITSLKRRAAKILADDDNTLELLDSWNKIALDEALSFLSFECKALRIPVNTGKQTLSIIQKSLTKYGLAQTATFIEKAVDSAHLYGSKMNYSGRQTFNLVYGKMCFWVDDEKSRQYKTRPLNRGKAGLEESKEGIVFYHAFLAIYGVDFFSDPINLKYLNPVTREASEKSDLSEA